MCLLVPVSAICGYRWNRCDTPCGRNGGGWRGAREVTREERSEEKGKKKERAGSATGDRKPSAYTTRVHALRMHGAASVSACERRRAVRLCVPVPSRR